MLITFFSTGSVEKEDEQKVDEINEMEIDENAFDDFLRSDDAFHCSQDQLDHSGSNRIRTDQTGSSTDPLGKYDWSG
jgi:hypothetical protein